MGVLMLFHCMNFKNGSLLKSQSEGAEQPYATIMPGELHRFDTEELDTHSLASRSSYGLDESNEAAADGETERSDIKTDKQTTLVDHHPSLSANAINLSEDSLSLLRS